MFQPAAQGRPGQGPMSGGGFANNPLFQDPKAKESGAGKRPFSFL